MNHSMDGSGLLRGTMIELRRDPVAALLAIASLTVSSVISGLGSEAGLPLMILASSIAAFVFQYVLTRRVMRRGGLLHADTPGAAAMLFGLLFLSHLAIGLGLLLLILPGVWLYARWLAAVPILFAEGAGVTESLGASSARSRPLTGAIVMAAGIIYLPDLFGLAASMTWYLDVAAPLPVEVAICLAMSMSQVVAWYLAVAVYRLLRSEPVKTVFA